MRLSEITTPAEKHRLYQAQKAAKLAQYKAQQERYRQQLTAYAKKTAPPIKAGQKPPRRPTPPTPPVIPKPPIV